MSCAGAHTGTGRAMSTYTTGARTYTRKPAISSVNCSVTHTHTTTDTQVDRIVDFVMHVAMYRWHVSTCAHGT